MTLRAAHSPLLHLLLARYYPNQGFEAHLDVRSPAARNNFAEIMAFAGGRSNYP